MVPKIFVHVNCICLGVAARQLIQRQPAVRPCSAMPCCSTFVISKVIFGLK